MSLFDRHRTSVSEEDGYRRFDTLIAQLRVDGQPQLADKLDYMMRHVAWTTGSELIEEFGTEVTKFQKQPRKLSPELRQRIASVMEFVRQMADR